MTTNQFGVHEFYQFKVIATMHDGSERVAVVIGLALDRQGAESIYAACLRDATARARELFTGAAKIVIL